LKVIIPQQYASVQPLGIIKDVTCIPEGVGDGVGDNIGEGVGVGDTTLVVFLVKSRKINMIITINITKININSVLLGLDSAITPHHKHNGKI